MRSIVVLCFALMVCSLNAAADDSTRRIQELRSQVFGEAPAPAFDFDVSATATAISDDRELRRREEDILSKLSIEKTGVDERPIQGRIVESQAQIVDAAGNQRVSESERIQLGMIQGATERQSRELDDLARTFDSMKASLKSIVTEVGPAIHTKSNLSAPGLETTKLELLPEPQLPTTPKMKSSGGKGNRSGSLDSGNRYVTDEMPQAVISVDQADLWTGPSEDDTLLLLLPRDSKVAIETRVDEWYRVRTAQGVRAWLHGSVILFGPGPGPRSIPGRFIRVRAYDSSVS